MTFRVGKMSEFTHKVVDYIYVGNFFPKDNSAVLPPRLALFPLISLNYYETSHETEIGCGADQCTQELSIHTRDLKK